MIVKKSQGIFHAIINLSPVILILYNFRLLEVREMHQKYLIQVIMKKVLKLFGKTSGLKFHWAPGSSVPILRQISHPI